MCTVGVGWRRRCQAAPSSLGRHRRRGDSAAAGTAVRLLGRRCGCWDGGAAAGTAVRLLGRRCGCWDGGAAAAGCGRSATGGASRCRSWRRPCSHQRRGVAPPRRGSHQCRGAGAGVRVAVRASDAAGVLVPSWCGSRRRLCCRGSRRRCRGSHRRCLAPSLSGGTAAVRVARMPGRRCGCRDGGAALEWWWRRAVVALSPRSVAALLRLAPPSSGGTVAVWFAPVPGRRCGCSDGGAARESLCDPSRRCAPGTEVGPRDGGVAAGRRCGRGTAVLAAGRRCGRGTAVGAAVWPRDGGVAAGRRCGRGTAVWPGTRCGPGTAVRPRNSGTAA